MKYKFLLIVTVMSVVFSPTFAQTTKEAAIKRMTDSLKMEGLSQFAILYPILRQGSLTTDILGNANVKSTLNGKGLYDGKMNMTRVRANFSVPLVQWGKNTITGTVGYQQLHFQTIDITSYNPMFSNGDRSLTKSTASLTANFSRSDSLFNHLVIYSAGISGITDKVSSIKRINYLGTVTVPLNRTAYSSLSVGLVVILDPSSIAPVIPIVSYWRKFKDADLDLFVDIPQRIILRKQLSKRSWTTVGSELGGNLLFFDLHQPPLPQNNIYTNVEIKSGATFEYLLTKKLIVGVNGGLLTSTAWRMFDHDAKPTEYFFRSTTGSVPYVSFSISFLPFIKHL